MHNFFKAGELIQRKLQEVVSGKRVSPSTGLKVSYETDKSLVRRFHKEVIRQCFHKDDVGSVKDLWAEVEDGDGIIILVTEGKEVLGGVVVSHYWSTGKKIMLVSWLAVKLAHRSRNIGTLLIEEAKTYARNNGTLLLLGQIENPDLVSLDNIALGDPHRRVKFYSRFDCKRMEVPCYVPAFSEHEKPLFGIMLTMFPLSTEQAAATEIRLPELSLFVDELVGQDTSQESRNFVDACKGTVVLSPFKELYGGEDK